MHPLTNQLAAIICNNKSLADCSVEEMEAIIKQYPYFASAHLLLAAKNKSESKTNARQLSTASLYFSHPLWLNHFLNKKEQILCEKFSSYRYNPFARSLHTFLKKRNNTSKTLYNCLEFYK